MASFNNSPPGQLNSYYVHLEFSFTSELTYATAVQVIYPGQIVSQRSADMTQWCLQTSDFSSRLYSTLPKLSYFSHQPSFARILHLLNFPATRCAWFQAKTQHKNHLICGLFIQTEQTKHKGRQLNELSFMNLCMMCIYHMTFHLKLSQRVSKILQYH